MSKFSNRLEAYLSWISTGVKPEDFDAEPRNTTEYWLNAEAERLDRMSGENRATEGIALRSLVKADEKLDYNDLDNKPITLYEEDYSYASISVSDVINALHFDTSNESEMISFLDGLVYSSEGNVELLTCDNNWVLGAIDIGILSQGQMSGKIIIFLNGKTAEYSVFYGTEAGSIQGMITWEQGFQNLDENGNATITEVTVDDLTSGTWNGTLISKVITTSNTEEGKYYFTLKEIVDVKRGENLKGKTSTLTVDREALVALFPTLTMETSGLMGPVHPLIATQSVPDITEQNFNLVLEAITADYDHTVGEENMIFGSILYPLYMSKHKNSTFEIMGATFYFDADGWLYTINNGEIDVDIDIYLHMLDVGSSGMDAPDMYYVDTQCNGCFTLEKPASIFKYEDSTQKEVLLEGESAGGLYNHCITIKYNYYDSEAYTTYEGQFFLNIIKSNDTAFTLETLYDYMFASGLSALGCYGNNVIYQVEPYLSNNEKSIRVACVQDPIVKNLDPTYITEFIDTVINI